MSDDQIEQMWPDAEQRAARRAKLHANLDTFLDAFVEADGGWAIAEDADVSAFREIIYEIADLKFQRDCDGDSVVDFHIVNRRFGRLISTYVPHRPRGRDGEEPVTARDMLGFIRESTRSAAYLISSGHHILDTLTYDFKDVEGALPPVIRLAEAEATLIASFGPDVEWKPAMAEVEKFMAAYPDARDAHGRAKDAYMVVYGETSFFRAASEEIMDILATGRLEDARALVFEHRKQYGFGIRDAIDAYNAAHRANERRKAVEARARRAAEKAAEGAA